MLQQSIVVLIVLAAFAWALWYWMPAKWRRSMALALGRGSRRVGLTANGAVRIERAIADAPGCTSCDSCGSCATPGSPPTGPEPGTGRATVKIFPAR